jgi:hypothetical protein
LKTTCSWVTGSVSGCWIIKNRSPSGDYPLIRFQELLDLPAAIR